MDSSLQKFSQLPALVKEKLSAPLVLREVEELENKYQVKLALPLIKLAVGDLNWPEFESYLKEKLGTNQVAVQEVVRKMKSFLSSANLTIDESMPVAGIGQSNTSEKNAANFYFSKEDEDEVAAFRPLASSGSPVGGYERVAVNIINQFGFSDPEEVVVKRLINIVVSRLREIRDDLETLEILQKNRKVGGLGFSDGQSRQLLEMIKSYLAKGSIETVAVKQSDVVVAPATAKGEIPPAKKTEPSPMPSAKVATTVKKDLTSEVRRILSKQPVREGVPRIEEKDGLPMVVLPEEDELMVKPKVMELKQQEPIRPPKPAITPKAPTEQTATIEPVTKVVAEAPPSAKSAPEPEPVPIQPQPFREAPLPPKVALGGRPTLDDVKFAPKLVGPVEELAQMTLIDFRRLGSTPQAAAQKITEKIELLENESYKKRLEGVAAWQKSEVNKLYRYLGQAGMMEGKGIEEVINSRTSENKPTLTLEEFETIMELNRSLRF